LNNAQLVSLDDMPATINDEGAIAATVLTALAAATTGDITSAGVTSITGTAAEVQAALNNAQLVSLDDMPATISDEGAIAATVLSALAAATTGDITSAGVTSITGTAAEVRAAVENAQLVSLDAVDATIEISVAAAADLIAIDNNTDGQVDASAVTEITGSAANILTVINSVGITISSTYDATVNVGQISVADANLIDADTTGVITATISNHTIADLLGLNGVGNAYTIVTSDTAAAASDLLTIDNVTTVEVDATSVRSVTGTMEELEDLRDAILAGTIEVGEIAPTSTDDNQATSEGTPIILAASDFGDFFDVNGNLLDAIKFSDLPKAGVVEFFDGYDWVTVTKGQSIDVDEINAGHLRYVPTVNANGDYYDVVGFRVGEDGNEHLYSTVYKLTIAVEDTSTTYTGTAGDDVIAGENVLVNIINGLAGNDTLTGNAGNDFLYGGEGNDTLAGLAGDDLLDGGNGIDIVNYSASPDGITLNLNIGNAFSAGSGNDTLVSIENVTGSAFNDYIAGNNEANALYGCGGNDVISGNAGNDTIYGNGGNDNLYGGIGDDILNGGNGDDYLGGGLGDDQLFGGAGTDTLVGGQGNDYLGGGTENDILLGGVGIDTLVGGAGNDRLEGGAGNDILIGGANVDTFVFNTAVGPDNVDTLTDLVIGTDVIELSATIFTALAGEIGNKIGVDGTILTYNSATGAVAYDADGAGEGVAVDVMIIGTTTHPAVLGNDFLITA